MASFVGQYAQITITAVSPNTATLTLTQVVQSGNNATYSYTVSQGDPTTVISGGALYMVMTGMSNSLNNGFMTGTSFGAGTLTGQHLGGANEGPGSTGVGNCPSDSGIGVNVYTSADGLNGYIFQVGTNSFGGDGRRGFYEFYKFISGVGTLLGGVSGPSLHAPSVNDVIAISAENGVVTCWLNSKVMTLAVTGAVNPVIGAWSLANAELTSGYTGLNSFAIAGVDQYNWSKWGGGTVTVGSPGDNGTRGDSFLSGTVTQALLGTDTFTYANGDLHTANVNWVYPAGSFTVSSNVVYCSSATVSSAYRNDLSPGADQYAQCTAVITTVGATQNTGPAVRMQTGANSYYFIQYATNNFNIARMIAGTIFVLLTGTTFPVNGDTIKLSMRGNVLTAWINGIAIQSVVDNTHVSGKVGIYGAGNTVANGIDNWEGGNYTWDSVNTDNFNRADGSLGSNWTVGARNFENFPNQVSPSLAIATNAVAPSATSFGTALAEFGVPASTLAGNAGSLRLRRRKRTYAIS